jgi:hypothetical protein
MTPTLCTFIIMELCEYIYLHGVTNGGQASKYSGKCAGKSKHDIEKPSS